VLQVLQSRIASVPEGFEALIRQVESIDRLNALIGRAATANSLEELEPLLSSASPA
jgi:hypothetical protein